MKLDLSSYLVAVIACDDPIERLRRLATIVEATDALEAKVRIYRSDAVRELRRRGWTLQRIADELGISHQRVHQLEAGRQPK